MSIDLVPFPAREAGRLQAWLAVPHVARWWRPAWTDPVIGAFRTGAPVPDWIRAWRIDLDGRPIGYAHDRDVTRDGDGWIGVEGIGPGTRSVGLLIGEADAFNRKHGREAIRILAGRLFAESGVDRLVAAPHPDNWGAIIAFKKVGFRERGRRQFPDGPAMVLTLAKSVWSG